jgi:hypothetical protein
MLELSQTEVLELLAKQHAVREDRRAALKGRLQHFQRLGFPEGLNTGRGRAAIYDMPTVLSLLIAFEMLQIGLSGERVVQIMREQKDFIPKAAAAAGQLLGEQEGILNPHPIHKFDEGDDSFLLVFDPNALANFSSETEGLIDATDWGESFLFDGQMIKQRVRWCVVNTTLLISTALQHVSNLSGLSRAQLASELIELGSPKDGVK